MSASKEGILALLLLLSMMIVGATLEVVPLPIVALVTTAPVAAVGHGVRGGGQGVEAPVCWAALVIVHSQLPLPPQRGPGHQGLVQQHCGVAQEVPRGHVVSAVQDDVIVPEEAQGVGAV